MRSCGANPDTTAVALSSNTNSLPPTGVSVVCLTPSPCAQLVTSNACAFTVQPGHLQAPHTVSAHARDAAEPTNAPIRSAAGPLPELIRHNPLIHMQRTRAAYACLAQIKRQLATALDLKHMALGAELQAVLHVNTPAVSRD